MPRRVNVFIGRGRLVDEAFEPEIVHAVVEIDGRSMAFGASALAEEHLLAAALGIGGFRRIEPGGGDVEFGRRREVEHVLHLRHVRNLDAIELSKTFFHGVDRIAVEIGGAEFEFGEVLDRAETPLGTVQLLIEHAAQADRVETETPFLRPVVRI